MELFELKADIRETRGKNAARALRREGLVPAVLYGPEMGNEMLALPLADVEYAYRQSDTTQVLVNLSYEKEGKTVVRPTMIKDVQVDPVKHFIKHLDFLEIDLTKKISVMATVEPVGIPVGVEADGGILQIIRRELEIYCLPSKIPDSITVDVSALGIGDAIHVEEINMEDIEIPHDVNFTVITVVAPTLEEEDDEDEDAEITDEEGLEEGAEDSEAGESEEE